MLLATGVDSSPPWANHLIDFTPAIAPPIATGPDAVDGRTSQAQE